MKEKEKEKNKKEFNTKKKKKKVKKHCLENKDNKKNKRWRLEGEIIISVVPGGSGGGGYININLKKKRCGGWN